MAVAVSQEVLGLAHKSATYDGGTASRPTTRAQADACMGPVPSAAAPVARRLRGVTFGGPFRNRNTVLSGGVFDGPPTPSRLRTGPLAVAVGCGGSIQARVEPIRIANVVIPATRYVVAIFAPATIGTNIMRVLLTMVTGSGSRLNALAVLAARAWRAAAVAAVR